jgi:uncharacterized protein YggE
MQIMHIVPVLVLLFCLCAGVAAAADDTTNRIPEKNLIHVSGNGIVKTTPDRCEISFSVITKNPDVKAAQKENARKMDMVMAVLKDPSKGNLTPLEIGTSSYSLSEVYSPDDSLKEKFGENVAIYEVSNTITVETTRIDQVGDLIDFAVTSGANGVRSLQFTLSKEKTAEFRGQALNIAVDKAKADAEAVASALNQEVGPVHEVTVDDTSYSPVYYNQDVRSAGYAAKAPSPSIEPGSIDVSAKVSIAYEIL